MADVHLLGNIRSGVIHDYRVPIGGLRNATACQRRSFRSDRLDTTADKAGLQLKINKPGAGNLRRLAEVFDIDVFNDARGHLSRWNTQKFRQGHGRIALIIAKFRVTLFDDRT